MLQMHSCAINENMLEKLAAHIVGIKAGSRDFRDITCVFTGNRQGLFLKYELSKILGEVYFPPKILSFDDFVDTLNPYAGLGQLNEFEACRIIYEICVEWAPEALGENKTFCEFIQIAKEIASFIEKVDFECIENSGLLKVAQSADIGLDVPETINSALKNISLIREKLHERMEAAGKYSRAILYQKALDNISKDNAVPGCRMLFCGFFYLQEVELRIIKSFIDKGSAEMFVQGSVDRWASLKRLEKKLGIKFPEQMKEEVGAKIQLHSGFDTVSQSAVSGMLLQALPRSQKTVVVLPDNKALIPLINEISSFGKDANVACGFPLTETTLYKLIDSIIEAQMRRKESRYYSKDYLRIIAAPLVKNINVSGDENITRVLAHKIEEAINGLEPSEISGSLFLELTEIEKERSILASAINACNSLSVKVTTENLSEILQYLHRVFFVKWETAFCLDTLSDVLSETVVALAEKSYIHSFKLNLLAAKQLLEIASELRALSFSKENMPQEDVFKILRDIASGRSLKFKGSPLKGLQILGLYETHGLAFDNVVILDMNEGKMPHPGGGSTMIPGEIMKCLGIDRETLKEEIEKYQFKRLIAGAKNVHLIYDGSDKKEKSRFVEEIIWNNQKTTGNLVDLDIVDHSFDFESQTGSSGIQKDDTVIKRLLALRYSATCVDTYLNCPLKFYFRYVLGLKEKDVLKDDMEAVDIGNFIHSLLEDMFRRFVGTRPDINNKFQTELMYEFSNRFETGFARRMKSDSFMVKEVVRTRLEQFLENEKKRNTQKILFLESPFELDIASGDAIFKFTGKIDRGDLMPDGELLIIDYKTGINPELPSKNFDKLHSANDRESILKTVHSFQLPLYIMATVPSSVACGLKPTAYGLQPAASFINAALYNLRDIKLVELWDGQNSDERAALMTTYEDKLKLILGEIINPAMPFCADPDDRYCSVCPYFNMCR